MQIVIGIGGRSIAKRGGGSTSFLVEFARELVKFKGGDAGFGVLAELSRMRAVTWQAVRIFWDLLGCF